jgi:hypothetical protein
MRRETFNLVGRAPWALLLALVGLMFGGPAHAEKRVALVVGNSAYRNVTPLDNPKNDAKLMADALRQSGFALVGGAAQLDLDKAALDKAVQTFGNLLQGAEVGLFYYAGHGVQARGTNYLVPVGANPVKEADVDFQMLDTNLVLREMESAGTKLNIVILDACRNNPFAAQTAVRAVGRGLAQMQAPEGTLISFATQPGNVALDGTVNSPYTKALAETMRRPGLGIFRTFNEVGLAVMHATGSAQQPWLSSSPISGEFYFADPAVQAETPNSAAARPPPPTPSTSPAPSTPLGAQAPPVTPPALASAQVATAVAPPPPATAEVTRREADPMIETVSAFYQALGNADGNQAASLVIPEKRGSGVFNASQISKYYGSLSKPLQLIGVVALGDNKYQADYGYGAGSHTCRGSAVVTIVQRDGRPLIQSIKAPKDRCS